LHEKGKLLKSFYLGYGKISDFVTIYWLLQSEGWSVQGLFISFAPLG